MMSETVKGTETGCGFYEQVEEEGLILQRKRVKENEDLKAFPHVIFLFSH